MWTKSYWPRKYWAPVYWPPAGGFHVTAVADSVIIRVRIDISAEAQAQSRLTVSNEWGGLILCNPSGTGIYSDQRDTIVSLGYEILDEVPESGSTYVYVVGPYPDFFMNNRARFPAAFIRLPKGVPVNKELVKSWPFKRTLTTFGL